MNKYRGVHHHMHVAFMLLWLASSLLTMLCRQFLIHKTVNKNHRKVYFFTFHKWCVSTNRFKGNFGVCNMHTSVVLIRLSFGNASDHGSGNEKRYKLRHTFTCVCTSFGIYICMHAGYTPAVVRNEIFCCFFSSSCFHSIVSFRFGCFILDSSNVTQM